MILAVSKAESPGNLCGNQGFQESVLTFAGLPSHGNILAMTNLRVNPKFPAKPKYPIPQRDCDKSRCGVVWWVRSQRITPTAYHWCRASYDNPRWINTTRWRNADMPICGVSYCLQQTKVIIFSGNKEGQDANSNS